MNEDQQTQLLTEIRNILREQLEEYRRVTAESLAIQRTAFETQRLAIQENASLGRRTRVVVDIVVMVGFVVLLSWLFSGFR
ncbi:MAG: hypothetical protein ACRC8S_00285 [Fimbriiglobus sp.]